MRNTYVIHKKNNEANIKKSCLLYEILTDKVYSIANYEL